MKNILPLAHTPPHVTDDGRIFTLDPAPLLTYIAAHKSEDSIDRLSLLFHETFANAVADGVDAMRTATGVTRVSLSGGVFQNMLLGDILIPLLEHRGYSVYWNVQVSPGDGGLALGQAYAR